MTKKKITVQGVEITYLENGKDDYFSLTDIAVKFNVENANSLVM